MAVVPECDSEAARTAGPPTVAAAHRGAQTIPISAPAVVTQRASQRRSVSFTSTPATGSQPSSEVYSSEASADPVAPTSAPPVCSEPKPMDDSVVEADVLIVGTGLIGCLTAAALARRGLKVVQIDGKGIYGGAYKSLKLPELCDWVRAESQKKAQLLSCCHQTATPYGKVGRRTLIPVPTVASARPAAATAALSTHAPRDQASARFNEAAPSAAAGEIAATVISDTVAESMPEIKPPPPFREKSFTTQQITPASRADAMYEGAASSRPSHPHKQDSSEIRLKCPGGCAETTADVLRPLRTPSPCAAFLAESAVRSSGRCTLSAGSEWVCSLKENAEGLSFSLRRERQGTAALDEQSTGVSGRKKPDGDDCEERCSSLLADKLSHCNCGKACPPVREWGDSEHVFFSSRSFAFFPFATDEEAPNVTQFDNSTNAESAFYKRKPTHRGKAERAPSSGEKTDIASSAAAADLKQKSVRAEDRVGSTCAAAAVEKFKPKSAAMSDESVFVGSTPAPTTDGPRGKSRLDDKEALIKELMQCSSFSIDLLPRILYSDSAITHILLACGAAKYLEFRPVDAAVYLGELNANVNDLRSKRLSKRRHDGHSACLPESGEKPHRGRRSLAGKHHTAAASTVCFQPASSVSELSCKVRDGAGQAERLECARCRSESGLRNDSCSLSPAAASAGSQDKGPDFFEVSWGSRGEANGKATPQHRIDNGQQSLVGALPGERETGKPNSGGRENPGLHPTKGCSQERADEEGEGVEEELALVQLPLTRGGIFSSSLLSTQEKRLLMKFISNVAAPRLNHQFLSAARLWVVNKKQLANAYFGRARHAANGATARAIPPAQVGASAKAEKPGRENDFLSRGGEELPEEANSKAALNRHETYHIHKQSSVKTDVKLDDVTWEAYLRFHQLTENLQRLLSYGVCVSDFPLRNRVHLHSQEPGRCSRIAGKSAVPVDPRKAEQPVAKKQCVGVDETSGGCCGWKASEGHARLMNFLQSVGLYENHSGAWLYPMYGTGDLPQALARAASLSGGVYMLRASLVELKFVCLQSRLSASSPRFARDYVSPASSNFPSPNSTSLPGSQAASDTAEDINSKSQSPDASAGLSKLEFLLCKERGHCIDEVSSFLSMFHTALANVEALEAKLQTGITVRTRMLLFEADALPPLYERVRVHVKSKGFSQAEQECAAKVRSMGHIVGHMSPVNVLASYSAAAACSNGDTALDDCMPSRRSPSGFRGKNAHSVKKGVSEQNRVPPPTVRDHNPADLRFKRPACESGEENLSAQSINEQPTLCLGELLFPGLRSERARAHASYLASQKRKRKERTQELTNTAARRERKKPTEKHAFSWISSLSTVEATSVEGQERQIPGSAVNTQYAAQTVCKEAEGGPYERMQQEEMRLGGANVASNTGCSLSDYYTQASCHLIAVCSRSVLDGPGFRMCVCTVQSKGQSTFSKTGASHLFGRRVPTGSQSQFPRCVSLLKQHNIEAEVADRTSANGASFATNSAALTGRQTRSEEEAFSKRRGGDISEAELPRRTPLTKTAFGETPVPLCIFDSAESAASVVTPLHTNADESRKVQSVENLFNSKCPFDHLHLSGVKATVGTGGEAGGAESTRAVGIGSSSIRRAGHASGLSEVTAGLSEANQPDHAGVTVAWPVLVLQTDATCSTTPPDYVLLHLSHVDGAGVEDCGCSFRGELSDKCANLGLGAASRKTYVLWDQQCASPAPPSIESLSSSRGDTGNIADFTRHGVAHPSASRAVPQACAGTFSDVTAMRGGRVGHAEENQNSRPCQMLLHVLRRLLERGRHRREAAHDCLFVCGYISHTVRSDVQKQVQAWQSREYRGVVQRYSKYPEMARQRGSSDAKSPFFEGETYTCVNNEHASGFSRTRHVEARDPPGVSPAATSSSDGCSPHASHKSSVASDNGRDMLPDFAVEARTLAKEQNYLSQSEEGVAPKHNARDGDGGCKSRVAVRQCGCLLLPAVPSTPLWFLLEEPKAFQGVLEVLLHQQIDVADLVPPHVGHEAQAAADELQRLSAPYEKLSEIVARVPRT